MSSQRISATKKSAQKDPSVSKKSAQLSARARALWTILRECQKSGVAVVLTMENGVTIRNSKVVGLLQNGLLVIDHDSKTTTHLYMNDIGGVTF